MQVQSTFILYSLLLLLFSQVTIDNVSIILIKECDASIHSPFPEYCSVIACSESKVVSIIKH